ncbi:beta-alanine--pyruvate transaminase [Limimonas halophila]|uniref:Beta-alanine--pyruvate transaminase n=1 Tax=Limimonas halophila TaxID=1082479 RepID=A0A1G7QY58_9PROT|nr:beta-alanine--pyruvate transaminase [Limimonas halophila]
MHGADDMHGANEGGGVHAAPNTLEPYWMPFTWNRRFKQAPKLVAGADGMHYRTPEGGAVLDSMAGLWCVNAGHNRERITTAIQQAAAEMDYAASFQYSHPAAFQLANQLTAMAPHGAFDHAFFTNSGSESVDSALKIALAYHRANGEPQRRRLIGRERGYHGVNFGGISVGGIVNNRRTFTQLPDVDHLPHTHDLEHQAFSRGQPEWGAHLADDLERLCALHGPETIAAVIVEPVAGSTGVLVPPKGYLQRLREICDKHGILLIFDEVITGFGRLGSSFAAEHFGVTPDLITLAKGISNAAVPMGAVLCRQGIYDALMADAERQGGTIEFFHGYTFGGHPLACAAALATLEVYKEEDLFARAAAMAPVLEELVHAFDDHPRVSDVRNLGMMAAIDLKPWPGRPGELGYELFARCFDKGVLVRLAGDTIELSPPLIAERHHLETITATIRETLDEIA